MVIVAATCVQYEVDYGPNMSVVVKAIQPLLGTWYIQTSDHTITISVILKYGKELYWYCKTLCIMCTLIEMESYVV